MSDESYALAIAEYQRGTGNRWYFLGANVGIYVAWRTRSALWTIMSGMVVFWVLRSLGG